MGKVRIDLPGDSIAKFCHKWRVSELSLFGSVLRDDFGPDSDVDVMVDFEPGVTYGLFQIVAMADDLEQILGREVDLLTRQAVEQSRNYIRRKAILSSAERVNVP